ncbi:MAG: ABC transporter substrate-binding protein, partial [Novosphingobium sp.]
GLVPGERTLIAELLARTGFVNAAAARGLGQGAVLPLEAMIARPPRVILAAGNPRADEDRLLAHPALRSLAPGTVRARFDPRLLYCAGPSVVRAAARLAAVRRALQKPLPPAGGAGVSPSEAQRLARTGPLPTPPASGRGEG